MRAYARACVCVFDLNYFGDIFWAPHQLIRDKTASLIGNELSFGSVVNRKCRQEVTLGGVLRKPQLIGMFHLKQMSNLKFFQLTKSKTPPKSADTSPILLVGVVESKCSVSKTSQNL